MEIKKSKIRFKQWCPCYQPMLSNDQTAGMSRGMEGQAIKLKFLISLLTLLLALFVFSSPAFAVLAKQIINPDRYMGAHGYPWIPVSEDPAIHGNVVFYETLETPSDINSGVDNVGWTSIITGSGQLNPNATSPIHTEYGDEVLSSIVTTSNADSAYYERMLSSAMAESAHKVWLRIPAFPTTNNKVAVRLNDSSDSVAVRLTTTSSNTFKVQVYNGTSYDDIIILSSTEFAVDVWHKVDIYYNATTNYCYARVDGGSWAYSTNAVRDNIQGVWLGSSLLNATGAGYTVYIDDYVARDATGISYSNSVIPDFTAHGLVSDASQSTYYQVQTNETNEQKFNFEYEVASPQTGEVKGIRIWEEAKQYGQTTYEHGFGPRISSTNYLLTAAVGASWKKIYNPHWVNPSSTTNPRASWSWSNFNAFVSAHRIGSASIQGIKLAELYTEIIYGASGDAYVTNELDFTATTNTIKAWVKVNEATNIKLCYGTNETYVKAGTGGDTTFTDPVTVTSATDYSTIFTIGSLSVNTTYYFDVYVQQADDSYLSMYYFEYSSQSGNLQNPYLANLQSCKTARSGLTDNFKFGVYADQHEVASHWDLFHNLGQDAPEFILELGDQELVDRIDPSDSTWTRDAREQVYTRRGYNAHNVHLIEAVGSKPHYRIWSDHDSFGAPSGLGAYINTNKMGYGIVGIGGGVVYGYVYKGFDLFKETQPMDELVVDDLTVTATGGSTSTCTTNDTVPITGLNGVHGGMVAHIFSGTTWQSYGIVKYILQGSPTTIYFAGNLSGSYSCTNGHTVRFSRGFIAQKAQQGNVDLIMGDLRKKRDPNLTKGCDKFDGTVYGLFSETASASHPREITGDAKGAADYMLYSEDYLSAQTGTSTTQIKHTDANLTEETTKWDMVCAWSSNDSVFRGCSLINYVTNQPQATMTYFGNTIYPSDGDSNSSNPEYIEAPGNMLAGDLAIIVSQSRSATGNHTISDAGGQTWNAESQINGSYCRTRLFWTRFNGSWSSTPSVNFGSAVCNSLRMFVYRPSYSTNTWAKDVEQNGSTYSAPSSPYKVTIPGITTNMDYTLVFAYWASRDDNLWGSLTSGWAPFVPAQLRNKAGNDQSQTAAWKFQGIAGSTGDVSQNQLYLGGDPGTYAIIAFKESVPGGGYGTIDLEWPIDGLAATDRIRIFESGASDWGCISYPDNCANVDHGHVQRSWVEQQIIDSTDAGHWALLIMETPMASQETMNYDKWVDVDGNGNWGSHYTFSSGDTTYCAAGTYYVSGYSIKPGGVNRPLCPPYDNVACGSAGIGRQAAAIEVENYSDLDNINEWWYDSGNGRVYFCDDEYIDEDYPFIIFRPDYWERAATRRYMIKKYGIKNVGFVGADRHFGILSNSQDAKDPWFYAGIAPSGGVSHACSRSYFVNGKRAWYHAGMSYVASYDDPDFDPEMLKVYGIFDVDNMQQKITVSLYERDGNVISNTGNNDYENSVLGGNDSDWLGNMIMDIQFVCPYGDCDYFNRNDSNNLGSDWTEDNADLDISSNAVTNGTDNTTGIAHWNAAIGVNQYNQIKITSISTDGDMGFILRSEASSGNRYSLVYDEGSTVLKWQRYNWNTYVDQVDSETVNLADNTWLSAIITGTGASTTIYIWVDTAQPNYYPYSYNRWNDVNDAPDYTLTCTGTCAADTGTYAGIIIKDEIGANSPVLDDFYSGDVTAAALIYSGKGIYRGGMRGVGR